MRLYEMFIGDFEKAVPWSTTSIKGCKRFLERVWNLQEQISGEEVRPEMEGALHQMIQKVSCDIEAMKFNTAISAMMSFVNSVSATGSITREEYRTLILLLNPFAPHITEELYQRLEFGGQLNEQSFPQFDPEKAKEETVEIAVQICGKVRARLQLPVDAPKEAALQAAKENPTVAAGIRDLQLVKEIYVPNRLVNLVVRKS